MFACLPAKRLPVCLPPKDLNVADNAPLVVTGWGLLKENGEKWASQPSELFRFHFEIGASCFFKLVIVLPPGKASSTLQKADINLISRSTCSSDDIYGPYITQRMICAGNLKGGVDACQVINQIQASQCDLKQPEQSSLFFSLRKTY